MREEAVVLCSWKRVRGTYKLWVQSRPRITGEGEDIWDAEDELIDAIRSVAEIMTPALVFDPPLPKTKAEAQFSKPELYLIGGGNGFWPPKQWRPGVDRESILRDADSYFQRPVCRVCHFAAAPRSERPLLVGYVSKGEDCGSGHASDLVQSRIYIFSERFLNALTAEEKRRLQFRGVERAKRSRLKFYELLGPAGLPTVGVAGLPVAGWICAACGYRCFGYWVEGLWIHDFVARKDLPKPLPGLFTVGQPPEVRLCATLARWQRLLRSGVRGLTNRLLGVVPNNRVVRSPKLKKRGRKKP